MSDAWAMVIAALITTVGGISAASFQSFKKMRKDNKDDHGMVMYKLDQVANGLDSVSERLDNHIDWHLKK